MKQSAMVLKGFLLSGMSLLGAAAQPARCQVSWLQQRKTLFTKGVLTWK